MYIQITIYRTLQLTVSDSLQSNKYTIRCNPDFHNHPWYDWVAVQETNSGYRFKFYLVHMLFQYSHEGTILSLAYLKYYQCLHRDDDTGMFVIRRTDKHEVLPISSLVRNVHMIPYFDSPTMATDNQLNDLYSFDMYLVNHFSDRFAFRYFSGMLRD